MNVITKDLKATIKLLNSVLTEGKVRTVGIKTEDMKNQFGDAVEKAIDAGITVPNDVISYFNLIFEDDPEAAEKTSEELVDDILDDKELDNILEDTNKQTEAEEEAEEEEKKPAKNKKELKKPAAKKKYKVRTPKENGVVAEACKLIKANPQITNSEILDELEIMFPDKARKGMYSTVGHVTCIARSFLMLFGIQVGEKPATKKSD